MLDELKKIKCTCSLVTWWSDVSNLEVFSCGDILNFMSKVIEFQSLYLYIYDTSLVVNSTVR